MERREFLLSGTSFAIGLMTPSTPRLVPGNPALPIRKAINGLPPSDPLVVNYSKAVRLLRNLPSNDPRNWQQQATIHNDYCPHSNWWFLPWHRAYLYYFESICRDVLKDDSFSLPYWDWTKQPNIPAPFLDQASPLWDSTRAKNGNIHLGDEIIGPKVIQSIVGSGALVDLFSGPTTTDQQREPGLTGVLEGRPHNGVHGTILGDMGNYMSPLDPIFWLHHCNVDRIWASWAKSNNLAPTANLWKNHQLKVFYDPLGKQQITATASDTLDPTKYRAIYDSYETAQPPKPVSHSIRAAMFGLEGRIAELPHGLKQLGFVASVSGDASLGRAQKTEIAVPADFASLFQVATSPAAEQEVSTYLVIEDVPRPAVPSTALRVFLNCKNPTLETPLTDPTYVGTVAFFGGEVHSAVERSGITFTLNVSETLAKVAIAGIYSAGTPIEVAILPVDLTSPGRTAVSETLKPRSLRLVGLEPM